MEPQRSENLYLTALARNICLLTHLITYLLKFIEYTEEAQDV